MKIDENYPLFVQRQKELVSLKIFSDLRLEQELLKKFTRLGFSDSTALSQRVQLEKEYLINKQVILRCLQKAQPEESFSIRIRLSKDDWLYMMQDILQYRRDVYSLSLLSALLQSEEALGSVWMVHLRTVIFEDGSVLGFLQSTGEGSAYSVIKQMGVRFGAMLGDKIVRIQLSQEGKYSLEEQETLNELSAAYGACYGDFCGKLLPQVAQYAHPVVMDVSMLASYLDRSEKLWSYEKKRERSVQSVLRELKRKERGVKKRGGKQDGALMGLGL